MAAQNRFYLEQLSKAQQKAYHAMREGLLAGKESIAVPRLSSQELSDLYFKIRMDDPRIFYSVTFKYRYYENSSEIALLPEYLFEKNKRKEHISAMDARVKKLARGAANLSQEEQLLYIHDFLCENVKYDKLKKEYSHEIIGALGNGVAVCEGIAKAFKVLCDALGIWCIVVLSERNPEKNIKYRHAWNLVKLGDSYYHVDATFDNTIAYAGILRRDYLKLSDKQIFRDHEPSIWPIPACSDTDHFYYKEKKQSWTTLDEVRNRTKQAVRKGKPLLFHWRGGYLTKEVLKDILQIFSEEAAKKELHTVCSVNWAQAVICARFEAGCGGDSMEMEETNEGERE